MAAFSAGLRTELRSNLLKALNDTLVSGAISDAVEEYLDEFLNGSDTNCWLDFEEGGPNILVGLGRDIAISFVPELDADPYGHIGGPRSEEQHADVVARIALMKTFIAELQAACGNLEEQVKRYEAAKAPTETRQ